MSKTEGEREKKKGKLGKKESNTKKSLFINKYGIEYAICIINIDEIFPPHNSSCRMQPNETKTKYIASNHNYVANLVAVHSHADESNLL